MTKKPISEVIAVLAKAAAETDGSEWQNESGSVITEYYAANGCTVTDHICDCEVINGDSPVATFIAAANPANVKRLIDHIAALEQQNARLQFIVESADKVQKEFADELGCAGDNEAILEAIDVLKQQLAAERARVVKLPKNKWHPCDCIDVVVAYDRDDVLEALRDAGIPVEGE